MPVLIFGSDDEIRIWRNKNRKNWLAQLPVIEIHDIYIQFAVSLKSDKISLSRKQVFDRTTIQLGYFLAKRIDFMVETNKLDFGIDEPVLSVRSVF